jgi:hypothetical protein
LLSKGELLALIPHSLEADLTHILQTTLRMETTRRESHPFGATRVENPHPSVIIRSYPEISRPKRLLCTFPSIKTAAKNDLERAWAYP